MLKRVGVEVYARIVSFVVFCEVGNGAQPRIAVPVEECQDGGRGDVPAIVNTSDGRRENAGDSP